MDTFVRRELHDDSGNATALALEGDLARDRPLLEIRARSRSLRISLGDAPLLWAHADVDGFDWTPAPEPIARALPSFDAAEARAMSRKSEASPLAWPRRLAEPLAALLLSRRTPVVWLTRTVEGRSQGPLQWVRRPYDETIPFEPGAVDWSEAPGLLRPWPAIYDGRVLPLRAWPSVGDARVKACRKLARDGALPPVVLLWVSGLQAWLLLDGHARWVAARAEAVPMHAVGALRPTPRAIVMDEARAARLRSAQHSLEELTHHSDGARVAAEANRIASRLHESTEWYAIDRASPFDEARFATEIAAARAHWREQLDSRANTFR